MNNCSFTIIIIIIVILEYAACFRERNERLDNVLQSMAVLVTMVDSVVILLLSISLA